MILKKVNDLTRLYFEAHDIIYWEHLWVTFTLPSVAIIAEVIATSALKASAEFTKLVPSIVVVVGYMTAFYCLSIVLKTIPVGIAYAIWGGAGIVLITAVGAVVFKQIPDLAAIIGMGFIILGIVILFTFSKTSAHW